MIPAGGGGVAVSKVSGFELELVRRAFTTFQNKGRVGSQEVCNIIEMGSARR